LLLYNVPLAFCNHYLLNKHAAHGRENHNRPQDKTINGKNRQAPFFQEIQKESNTEHAHNGGHNNSDDEGSRSAYGV